MPCVRLVRTQGSVVFIHLTFEPKLPLQIGPERLMYIALQVEHPTHEGRPSQQQCQ